jgi:hypothetical protein
MAMAPLFGFTLVNGPASNLPSENHRCEGLADFEEIDLADRKS